VVRRYRSEVARRLSEVQLEVYARLFEISGWGVASLASIWGVASSGTVEGALPVVLIAAVLATVTLVVHHVPFRTYPSLKALAAEGWVQLAFGGALVYAGGALPFAFAYAPPLVVGAIFLGSSFARRSALFASAAHAAAVLLPAGPIEASMALDLAATLGAIWLVALLAGVMGDDAAARFSALDFTSVTDPLTRLYNRSYFVPRLLEVVQRLHRSGGSFAAMMIDIDGFKCVNDTHGHLVGDSVLKRVSERITGSVRRYDVAARLGGEEFGILLPDVSREVAVSVAERVRSAVAGEPIEASLPAANGAAEAPSVGVTISVGVAWWQVDPDRDLAEESEVLDVLTAADEALYQAKRKGGDAVSIVTGPGDRSRAGGPHERHHSTGGGGDEL